MVAGGAKGESDLREVPLPAGGENAAEALAVGRGTIVRRALDKIRRSVDEEETSRSQAAIRIVGLVEEEGLRPMDPPERVRPITRADLGVVCWMEVLSPAPG